MRSSPLVESSASPSRHLSDAPTPRAPESGPQRRAHFDAWYLDVGDHGSPRDATRLAASDHRLEWHADGSGSVVVTPSEGDSCRTVLAPAAMRPLFSEPPPASARAMGMYLRESAAVDDATDPVQMMDAVADLLNEWTLPTLHQSAVVLLLAQMAGITSRGVAVDRLGRPGIGYLAESPMDGRFAHLLVVGDDGDRILAIETIYRGGVDELDIATPAVVRSIAWR
jgi:hypothetical protein